MGTDARELADVNGEGVWKFSQIASMLSVKLKTAMSETSEGGAEGRSQKRRKCTKI